jgi:RNA polymerase sigma-70 factor (ECF subfamily)
MTTPDGDAFDALVARYRQGESGAIDQLIAACEPRLRLFVRSRCQRADDADEVVNASFVTAFQTLGQYQARGQFLAWLMTIAYNHLRSLRRTRWRHQGEPLEQALDRLWAEGLGDEPEERLSDLLEHLRHCLQHLDDRGRSLLCKHHVDGLSLADLADHYQRPAQTLARHLHQLRHRLRDCITLRGFRVSGA